MSLISRRDLAIGDPEGPAHRLGRHGHAAALEGLHHQVQRRDGRVQLVGRHGEELLAGSDRVLGLLEQARVVDREGRALRQSPGRR